MLGSMQGAVRGLGVLLAPLAVVATGCAPAEAHANAASAAEATSAPDTSSGESDSSSKSKWEACYSTFGPTGDAEGDLARLVRDCGAQGGMRAVTKVRLGHQTAEDPADRFTFEVPSPGKCYRVYAASDSGVQDLDLLLRGPSGNAMVGDVTRDSWPVLPPTEPVCFSEAGLYMLEVSVYKGAGRYALQVWGR
jgi:hypothetical protein